MPFSSLFAASAAALTTRRSFLRVAGASGATAALVLAGCGDSTTTPTDPYLLTLQTADTGLLNYIYLLEQLEAAFYQQILDVPPADLQPGDLAYFTDLRDHELIHRETLLYALGTNAVPPLGFDFSTFTMNTRAGVLAAARTLEELGVAAYTGILPLVADSAVLQLLLKMASVEARHADFINDLLTPGSFATAAVVDEAGAQAVALSKTPTQVIADSAPLFLPYKVSVEALPTA